MKVIPAIRKSVRSGVRLIAHGIDTLSSGRITPNMITLFGFSMHIPIAILITRNDLVLAAILLIIFGLFDAVDGELARIQKKSSSAGMLLDASTDRFKEVLIYTSAAYNIAVYGKETLAYVAVAACGSAVCVSYVKAKGESAIATSGKNVDHAKLNHLFADGIASFDVRVLIFIGGLFTNNLVVALSVITILSASTAVFRLIKITKTLSE